MPVLNFGLKWIAFWLAKDKDNIRSHLKMLETQSHTVHMKMGPVFR